MVKNTVTIQGDPAATFKILTDFPKYMEWYPECEAISVAAVNGDQTDVNLQLGGMKVARMVLRYDCKPDCVSFTMVSSPDLKGFTGSYKIINGGNGTHTVQMEVDLTASVPKFVTDRMMKGSLEKQAAQLQKRNSMYAGSGGGEAAAAAGTGEAAAGASGTPESGRPKWSRCLVRVKRVGDRAEVWYAGSAHSRK